MSDPLSVHQSPSSPETQAAGEKSALQSRTIIGIGIALLPVVARHLGFEMSDADAQANVNDALTIVGAGVAIYGRLKATRRIALVLLLAATLAGCAGTSGTFKAGTNERGEMWTEIGWQSSKGLAK